jgi:hypothetical protein
LKPFLKLYWEHSGAFIGWSIDGDTCEIRIREKYEKKTNVNQIRSVATTLFLRVDDGDDDERFYFVILS